MTHVDGGLFKWENYSLLISTIVKSEGVSNSILVRHLCWLCVCFLGSYTSVSNSIGFCVCRRNPRIHLMSPSARARSPRINYNTAYLSNFTPVISVYSIPVLIQELGGERYRYICACAWSTGDRCRINCIIKFLIQKILLIIIETISNYER